MYIKTVSSKLRNLSGLELAQIAVQAAREMKAENPVILDLSKISSISDYLIIMSGLSTRHVQSLARAVDEALAVKRLKSGNTEGLAEGHWVLLDFDNLVIHIFHHESRDFYDLEGFWHDAPRISG